MSEGFDLKNVEVSWVLGILRVEQLPRLATEALTAGFRSKLFEKLAACSPEESQLIRQLFEDAIKENGGGKISKLEALREYAKQISVSILDSTISPFEGAKLIWRAATNAGVKEYHELDGF